VGSVQDGQVVSLLQRHPERRRGAEVVRQPQRRIGRDGAPAVQDLGDPVGRHVQGAGQGAGRNADLLQFTGSALDLDPTGDERPFDDTDPPDPAKPKGRQRNPVLERIRAELKAKKAAQAAAANAEGVGDADTIADAWEAALGTDTPDAKPTPKPGDDGKG
jgi:hypothetical protein